MIAMRMKLNELIYICKCVYIYEMFRTVPGTE